MLNLLETNTDYKNLKREIVELFPNLSPYIVASIYTETLRGQIRKREIADKEKNGDFKWKKLYYENPKDKKKYKSYIIKLPNFFENICPFEITKDNLKKYVEEIKKVMALICREKAYEFDKMHALTILILWEQVGRYRSIEKKALLKEINCFTDMEQGYLDEILNDLVACGLVVKLRTEYGIRMQIKL